MELTFPFLAGILAFLSPCIIPMITVYLSLITGMTADELLSDDTVLVRRQIVINTAYFVGGFAVIYMAVGAAAGYVGGFLSNYQAELNVVGGTIIVLLGLRFAGVLTWLPADPFGWLKSPSVAGLKTGGRSSGAGRSFGVGVLFAVACSHCFGGLLTSVLVSAGVSGSQTQGMLSLALFSLGLAVPFFITAWAIGPVINRLKKAQKNTKIINVVGGGFLIFFGILTATGRFTMLAEFFSRLSPL